MKVVIIEDEKIAADDLVENLLAVRPDYQIEKILSSISEALLYFQEKPEIDLIFSDIQLSDGLCFYIFKQYKIEIPIIFCTAYQEYAIDAFNSNGIDYIIKPFDIEAIKKSINKFELLTVRKEIPFDRLLKYLSHGQSNNNTCLLVNQKNIIKPINSNDICIIRLNNGVVKLLTVSGETYFTTQSLEEIEKMKISFFFRANRQYIVNRKIIKEVEHHFNRKLLVHLTIPFDEQIFISKEKTSAFLNWLTTV